MLREDLPLWVKIAVYCVIGILLLILFIPLAAWDIFISVKGRPIYRLFKENPHMWFSYQEVIQLTGKLNWIVGEVLSRYTLMQKIQFRVYPEAVAKLGEAKRAEIYRQASVFPYRAKYFEYKLNPQEGSRKKSRWFTQYMKERFVPA